MGADKVEVSLALRQNNKSTEPVPSRGILGGYHIYLLLPTNALMLWSLTAEAWSGEVAALDRQEHPVTGTR